MQDRVLRAKLSFFTKTRVGSITQRFGSDLVKLPDAWLREKDDPRLMLTDTDLFPHLLLEFGFRLPPRP